MNRDIFEKTLCARFKVYGLYLSIFIRGVCVCVCDSVQIYKQSIKAISRPNKLSNVSANKTRAGKISSKDECQQRESETEEKRSCLRTLV